MSTESTSTEKKRRSTSIPFLVIVLALGLVGFFRGKEIMTYVLYLQEKWTHDARVAQDQRYDELMGPPEEGDYGWVAPDAEGMNQVDTSARDSSQDVVLPTETDQP